MLQERKRQQAAGAAVAADAKRRRSAVFKRRAVQEARKLAAELKARLTADDVLDRSSQPDAAKQNLSAPARFTIDNADCSSVLDQAQHEPVLIATMPRSICLVGGGFRGGGSSGGSRRASSFLLRRRSSGRSSNFHSSSFADRSATSGRGSRSSLGAGLSSSRGGQSHGASDSGCGSLKRRCRATRVRALSAVVALDPLMVDVCILSSRPAQRSRPQTGPAGIPECGDSGRGGGSGGDGNRAVAPAAATVAGCAAAGKLPVNTIPADSVPADSIAPTLERLLLQQLQAEAGAVPSRLCEPAAGLAPPALPDLAQAAEPLVCSGASGGSGADEAADHESLQIYDNFSCGGEGRPAGGSCRHDSSSSSSDTLLTASSNEADSVGSIEDGLVAGCPRGPGGSGGGGDGLEELPYSAVPGRLDGADAATPVPRGLANYASTHCKRPFQRTSAGVFAPKEPETIRGVMAAAVPQQKLYVALDRACSLPLLRDLQPDARHQHRLQQHGSLQSPSSCGRMTGPTDHRRPRQQSRGNPASEKRMSGVKAAAPQQPLPPLSLCGVKFRVAPR